MAEYIEREALIQQMADNFRQASVDGCDNQFYQVAEDTILEAPAADVVEVVHGRWIYEAHKENANYRWNVTAECSECCDERNEVWAGFFPGVPDWLARDVALQEAQLVKLSNYCPNCGAKMDGGKDNATD